MSQRIDALRSVFSVNLRSSTADKPGSGFSQPQSRQPGRVHLRAVKPPEPDRRQPARIETVSPPPDRRMFRRRNERPVIQAPGISRQAFHAAPAPDPPVHDAAADRGVTFRTDLETLEPVFIPAIEHETVLARANVPEKAVPDSEEDDETYLIDRPLFLLSQKYFGTRF